MQSECALRVVGRIATAGVRTLYVAGNDVEHTRRHLFKGPGTGATVAGMPGARIVDGLKPAEGETVVIKKRFSPFFGTHLDMLLRRCGLRSRRQAASNARRDRRAWLCSAHAYIRRPLCRSAAGGMRPFLSRKGSQHSARVCRWRTEHLVLCGVQTPNCIRTCAFDAISLDYDVTVLSDATASQSDAIQAANLQGALHAQRICVSRRPAPHRDSALRLGGARRA